MISLIERLASPTGSGCEPPSTCGLVDPDPPPHPDIQTPASRRPTTAPRATPLPTCPVTLAVPIVMPLCCRPRKPPSSTHKQLVGHRPSRSKALPAGAFVVVPGRSVVGARYHRATSWFPFCRIIRGGPPISGARGGHRPCCGSGGAANEDGRQIRVFRSRPDGFAGLVGRLRQLALEFGRRRAGSVGRLRSVGLRGSVRPRDAGDLLG